MGCHTQKCARFDANDSRSIGSLECRRSLQPPNILPYYKHPLSLQNMNYLVAHAGKDLTHLFHPNGEPRSEISERSGLRRVLFPPILEVAISDRVKTKHTMWSQDPMYHIGRVTRRPRLIRLINALTMTTQVMKVCDEDTIFDIQQKYKARYNHHAGSYEWRRGFSASENSTCKFGCDHICEHPNSCGPLNLNGTLDDNDLLDEEDCDVELPPPALWLYYTDDLTIA